MRYKCTANGTEYMVTEDNISTIDKNEHKALQKERNGL